MIRAKVLGRKYSERLSKPDLKASFSDVCLVKTELKSNENHFVNFTGATFALATQLYTSMYNGRLHQQVSRGTWKSILSQISFREKNV